MVIVSSSAKKSAFTFPEVLVVEASAGSGKTYTLAKRYVQLLLDVAATQSGYPSQSILALTFTNKAAFEMKQRILHFLKGLALQNLPAQDQENILQPLGLSSKQAADLSFHIMDDIIHHYHFFQVQTIDKFINTLLSGCSFKVGLTSRFRIRTTAQDYLEYSLDRLIDSALGDEDLRGLFEGFLDNYLYLENRTGWFPKRDVLDVVKGLYSQMNHYGLEFDSSPTASSDLAKSKHQLLEKIKVWRTLLPEKTNARFLKSLDKFIAEHQFAFDIDKLPNFSAEEPPLNKGAEASGDVYAGWEEIQGDVRRLCLNEAYSLYNPYIVVFEHVMKSFDKHAATDDVLFLEELNRKAQLLFDDGGVTVEELYFRLATRLQHFLIDEFQDTSRLQWMNLRLMPEEALASGGSLFYVGDRKQAIYGFRGGDVRLFDEIQREYADYTKQEVLTNNYRSQKNIVKFNNQVFSMDNIQRFIQAKEGREREKKAKTDERVIFHGDDYRRLDNIFSGAQQSYQESNCRGFVQVRRIDHDSQVERLESTCDYVLETLEELRNRFEWRDIAILTRENMQVETVTNWLLDAGIPVDSERTSNIKDNDRVREIVALLTFLNSPVNNIAFAEFIMGKVFSLASGISEEELRGFVFNQRESLRRQRDFYLYQEFRKTYPEAWDELLEGLYRNVGLYPLYELVITLYERLQCVHHFSDDQGFFMLFLELVKKREEEHSDIASFLEYYDGLYGDALYAHIPGLNAVKVLTVHKSKGLEFPVVFLPFLKMDVKVGSKTSDAAQSYLLQRVDEKLRLLRLKKTYYRYSDELYQVYRKEYVDALISELNNVYVALTRASHEMYICVPSKAGQSFNWANLLIPEDFESLGTQEVYGLEQGGAQKELMILDQSHHQDWITYLNDENLAYQREGQFEVRLKGTMLHEVLSYLICESQEELQACVDLGLKEVIKKYGRLEWREEIKQKVLSVIEMSDFQGFLLVPQAKICTEYEVVDRYGHTRRMDRVVVGSDEVSVIDYKSSAQDTLSSRKQLRQYIQILKEIYPSHQIKGYLLYIDELKLEAIADG